jgi:hypothetical protein
VTLLVSELTVGGPSGVIMDPIRLIVTALTAGTALGLHGSAETRLRNAYANLWDRVRKRLACRPDAAMVLARHAEAPQTWAAPLTAELAAVSAGQDDDLVAAATALLSLTEEACLPSGRYTADAGSPPVAWVPQQAAPHSSLNGQPGR